MMGLLYVYHLHGKECIWITELHFFESAIVLTEHFWSLFFSSASPLASKVRQLRVPHFPYFDKNTFVKAVVPSLCCTLRSSGGASVILMSRCLTEAS